MIIGLAISPLIFVSLLSFYAEIERYCRHYVFFGFCKLTPVWFEDGFIEVNINLSKIFLE